MNRYQAGLDLREMAQFARQQLRVLGVENFHGGVELRRIRVQLPAIGQAALEQIEHPLADEGLDPLRRQPHHAEEFAGAVGGFGQIVNGIEQRAVEIDQHRAHRQRVRFAQHEICPARSSSRRIAAITAG